MPFGEAVEESGMGETRMINSIVGDGAMGKAIDDVLNVLSKIDEFVFVLGGGFLEAVAGQGSYEAISTRFSFHK